MRLLAFFLFVLTLGVAFVPASARPAPQADDAPPQQSGLSKPLALDDATVSLDTAISIFFNSLMLVLQVANICIACQQMRAVLQIAAGRFHMSQLHLV